MKNILMILFLVLLLSGCAGPRDQGGLIAGVILLVGTMIALTIIKPFFWGMEKADKIKNDSGRKIIYGVMIAGIIFVLINLDKVFVVIGRAIGLGN